MWKWVVAFVSCVAFWVACDFALQHSASFAFGNFMRLPLQTAVDLAGYYHWCQIAYTTPFWWIGALIVAAYAALGFLPLILVPLVKRRWPLWLTVSFLMAHPAVWLLALASGHH